MSSSYDQAKYLAAIHRCSAVIIQMDDPVKIGNTILEVLEELLYYERCAIVLVDEPGRTLRLLVHSSLGLEEREAKAEFARVANILGGEQNRGVVWRVIESGKFLNLANVSNEADYLVGASSIESELCVPLQVFGVTIGAINVESSKQNAFGRQDIDVLVTLAGQVALAIENAKLAEASGKMHLERTLAIRDAEVARQALDKSEALRHLAMDIAQLGHAVWDKNADKCIYCSELYANIHGLSVDEFFRRTSTLEGELSLIHPQDRGPFRAHIDASRAGGKFDLKFRIITPEGEIRHVHEIIMEVLHGDGLTAQELCTIQDITSEKKIEAKRLQAQKMETLGQLTSGVAHDFNNLLTVILGNSGLIAKQKIKGVDGLIQPVLQAARLGSHLTERLLAFARLQPPKRQRVNLKRVLTKLPELLERILGENIVMRTNYENDLWDIHADSSQIDTALLNLAINARDAMPDGGKLIMSGINMQIDRDEFERNPKIEMGNYVALSVRDTGTGMSRDVLKKAFDPFFTTKNVGKGSGLGLALVNDIATQWGGHVTIDSKQDGGTTVNLYLPKFEPIGEAL